MIDILGYKQWREGIIEGNHIFPAHRPRSLLNCHVLNLGNIQDVFCFDVFSRIVLVPQHRYHHAMELGIVPIDPSPRLYSFCRLALRAIDGCEATMSEDVGIIWKE